MEVEVLRVDGVSQDAIVSIRAGASRRQAPVSSLSTTNTPFRFSGGAAGMNPFKLDVLQPIGSARMVLKPGGGTFCVPVEGGSTADGVAVTLAIREAGPLSPSGAVQEDLFERIDRDKDGIISRREFNDAIRRGEGDKPVLQPLDDGKPIVVSPSGGTRLPPLPKDEDDIRLKSASVQAKEYLEGHQLLPFVRALLQTVIRERPGEPYNFIAEQFSNAAKAAEAATETAMPPESVDPKPPEDSQARGMPMGEGWKPEQIAAVEAMRHAVLEEKLAPPIKPAAISCLERCTDSWWDEMYSKFPKPEVVDAGTSEQLSRDDEALLAAKERAMDALTRALEDVEEAPGATESTLQQRLLALEERRESMPASAISQEALEIMLRAEAEALGCDLTKLSHQEQAAAKLKAKAAMLASFQASLGINPEARAALEEALRSDGGHLSYNELDEAKQKARKILASSLLMEDEALTDPEMATAKHKAQKALTAALMSDRALDEELEETKSKARTALMKALLKEEDLSEEELKVKAHQALSAALLEQEGDIEGLKATARDALTKALGDDDEEDLEGLKSTARDALMVALLSNKDDEVERAKSKAREALYASLLKDSTPDAKLEQAKGQAREALSKALLDDEDSEELEDAKKRARAALRGALLKDKAVTKDLQEVGATTGLIRDDEDDTVEVERAKVRCREALTAALLGDNINHQDMEAAKDKARAALGKALLEEGDDDIEEVKARAREALAAAMLDPDEEDDELRGRARDALAMALLDDEAPDQVVEEAKEKARSALMAALMTDKNDEEDVKLKGRMALEAALEGEDQETQELEDAKERAREALFKALSEEPAAGEEPAEAPAAAEQAEPIDDELAEANKVKAQLAAAREQMTSFNHTLRDEVDDLKSSLKELMKERDALKQRLAK